MVEVVCIICGAQLSRPSVPEEAPQKYCLDCKLSFFDRPGDGEWTQGICYSCEEFTAVPFIPSEEARVYCESCLQDLEERPDRSSLTRGERFALIRYWRHRSRGFYDIGDDWDDGYDGVLIGNDVETGESVVIDDESRQRGLYIIGKTGTGKTTLIESLIRQDIEAGFGVCVLDPHGDLVTRLLAAIPEWRKDDVVLLDPSDANFPFGLNPYHCANRDDPAMVGRTQAGVVELFQKLWGPQGSEGNSWGPQVAQIIRNTAAVLIDNPGYTMAEIPRLLTDGQFRNALLENVQNPQVRFFWSSYERQRTQEQDRWAQSTQNKIDEFLSQPIARNVVSQNTTVNFREFMDDSKIVLVPLELGSLGRPVVNLFGSIILLQILNAAFSRGDIPEDQRTQFNLYADEFQRFATPSFAELLTDARKYHVSTTLAHQTRSQLDDENREAALNAGSLIVFGVHGEDAEELAKQFDATPPPPDIVGQEPLLTISQDPLGQLVNKGHGDQHVEEISRDVFQSLYFHEQTAWNSPSPKNPKVIAKINDYLIAMMRGSTSHGTEEQAWRIAGIYWAWKGRGPDEVLRDLSLKAAQNDPYPLPRYFNLFKRLAPNAPKTSEEDFERDCIISALAFLGRALKEQPVREYSGQFLPKLDRPRSFADVQAEVATRLRTQPVFHATCRIVQDGFPREFRIRTRPASELEILDEAHTFADPLDLRQRSRGMYARHREDVERECELRVLVSPKTERSTARSVPVPARENDRKQVLVGESLPTDGI